MKLVAIIHVGKSEKKEKVLLSQPSTKKIASFNSKLPQGNKLSLKIIFAVSHFSLLLRKKGRTGWWATTGVFSPSFTVSIAFVPFLYLLKCLDCVKQLSLKLQNCFLYTVLMKCIKLSVLAECHKCFMLRNTRKKTAWRATVTPGVWKDADGNSSLRNYNQRCRFSIYQCTVFSMYWLASAVNPCW